MILDLLNRAVLSVALTAFYVICVVAVVMLLHQAVQESAWLHVAVSSLLGIVATGACAKAWKVM